MRNSLLFCAALLFGIVVAVAPAQTALDTAVEELTTDLSLQFKADHPDLVFRPNLAVIEITDTSEEARQHNIGDTLTVLIETKLQQSTIFNLIDPEKRDTLLAEIKFSLSGLSDTERLEPGRLAAVDYYLDGTVSSLADEFRLTLRAIEVNSSSVIFTGTAQIDKALLIERSRQLQAAYVSRYGIGIEISAVPFMYLHSTAADIEGQPVPGQTMLMQLDLNYRLNRNFLFWGSFQFSAGGIRFSDTWEPDATYSAADWDNLGDPGGAGGNNDLQYSKDRTYWSTGLGAGYVFNLNRNFNITLGGQLQYDMHYLTQLYRMPNTGSGGETVSNIITSADARTTAAGPVLKLQYFLGPRFTLNLRYSYMQQQTEEKADLFYYSDVRYSEGESIPALYELRPNLDINGREHSYDLSGHRMSLGIGFYF